MTGWLLVLTHISGLALGIHCGWSIRGTREMRRREQVGSLIPSGDGGTRFVWRCFDPVTGAQPVYRLTRENTDGA